MAAGAVDGTNPNICDFKLGAMGSPARNKLNAEVIAGFGEGAYASSPGYGMQQLGVHKGTSHVIAIMIILGAPEAKAKVVVPVVMHRALV